MENTLEIGVVSKPQGVKGELKVYPLGQDMLRLECLKRVYIDGKSFKIENIKFGGGFMIVSLFGVSDRNQAEFFRGKYLSALREDLPELEEGSEYAIRVTESGVAIRGKDYNGLLRGFSALCLKICFIDLHEGKESFYIPDTEYQGKRYL